METSIRLMCIVAVSMCFALGASAADNTKSENKGPNPSARYQWKSKWDLPAFMFSDGIVVQNTPDGNQTIKVPSGGKGSIPVVGKDIIIDLPGSRDVRIEIDEKAKNTEYAGLTFVRPCILEIRSDGTLLSDREGILAKDKDGAAWSSQKVVLDGKEIVAFFAASASETSSAEAEIKSSPPGTQPENNAALPTTSSTPKERIPASVSSDSQTENHPENQKIIAEILRDADKNKDISRSQGAFERWRLKTHSQLSQMYDQGVANRFSDATYAYNFNREDTPPALLQRGLGFLEGLLLTRDLSVKDSAAINTQIRRFIAEAEAQDATRKQYPAFGRWNERVRAFLEFAVDRKASVEFANATSYSPGELEIMVSRGLGVLDGMLDPIGKSAPQVKTSSASGLVTPAVQSGRKSTEVKKEPFESTPEKWPPYSGTLIGRMEVRVRNPNAFKVRVGLRSDGKGKDFVVAANDVDSVRVPKGRYDVYFQYSNEPDGLFQGDSFSLNNNGVEIQIVKVVDGNFGIRRIK